MCKSGFQKVMTARVSVLANKNQGSPNISLHRAWVCLLYQSPNSVTPSPPTSCGLTPGHSGAGAEHGMAQMEPPIGPNLLLLFPGCTANCPPAPNHCVCLWMAGKGLQLPISCDCSVHPKLGLSPSKGPREWSAQERWPPLWALLLLPAMPSTQKILENK